MTTGDFPPPKGMHWTDANGWVPDLPESWGTINGEDHPDSVIANAATKAERERCLAIVDGRVKVWNDALKAECHGDCAQSLAEECEDIAMMIRRG